GRGEPGVADRVPAPEDEAERDPEDGGDDDVDDAPAPDARLAERCGRGRTHMNSSLRWHDPDQVRRSKRFSLPLSPARRTPVVVLMIIPIRRDTGDPRGGRRDTVRARAMRGPQLQSGFGTVAECPLMMRRPTRVRSPAVNCVSARAPRNRRWSRLRR